MDASIDPEEVVDMKYAELRKVAKSVGIKANQKADKLVKALQDYIIRQRIDTGKPATQEVATPKMLTPLNNYMEQSVTPLGPSIIKPVAPMSLPGSKPSTPKGFPSLHRLRTPPAGRRSESLLLTPGGSRGDNISDSTISNKRTRTASFSSEMYSAKKPRTNECVKMAEGDATPRRTRSRSSTYDKELSTEVQNSPGQVDLIASMAETETDAERKEKLLAALDKKVQLKMGNGKQNFQIPRFVAFCALKKATEENAKKATPGQERYMKAHAKNFDKMASLDQYLENRRKRTEALGSAQKVRADQTSSALKKLKALTEGSLSVKKVEARRKLINTPPNSEIKFLPKVTSVAKVNFDFSTTKTPGSAVQAKPKVDATMKGKENADKAIRQKSMGTAVTPFKFAANLNKSLSCSLNKSAVKPKFDLSASLNRPITWKPHRGKLRPFVETKSDFQKDIKAVSVTTKAERRQQSRANQNRNRHGVQMRRRGLAV